MPVPTPAATCEGGEPGRVGAGCVQTSRTKQSPSEAGRTHRAVDGNRQTN